MQLLLYTATLKSFAFYVTLVSVDSVLDCPCIV